MGCAQRPSDEDNATLPVLRGRDTLGLDGINEIVVELLRPVFHSRFCPSGERGGAEAVIASVASSSEENRTEPGYPRRLSKTTRRLRLWARGKSLLKFAVGKGPGEWDSDPGKKTELTSVKAPGVNHHNRCVIFTTMGCPRIEERLDQGTWLREGLFRHGMITHSERRLLYLQRER